MDVLKGHHHEIDVLAACLAESPAVATVERLDPLYRGLLFTDKSEEGRDIRAGAHRNGGGVMDECTRADLLAICEAAFVPQQHWSNRDTASAQRQLGEAYALLKAGCEFWLGSDTDHRTIWVVVTFEGFAHKDYNGGLDTEHFYLPTRERLAQVSGKDWY